MTFGCADFVDSFCLAISDRSGASPLSSGLQVGEAVLLIQTIYRRMTRITVRDSQRNPELIIRNKLPRVNQKANPKVSPRGSHRIGKPQELPRAKERVVKVIRREEVRKEERVERRVSIIHK